QYGLAVRVARMAVPGVQGPGSAPRLLVPKAHVVRRGAPERKTADPGHLEFPAQRALHVIAPVPVVARGRRPDHDRIVAVLDVRTRQPIRPIRGKIRLAAHQGAENGAGAAGREVAVLEPPRHVEPQAQVVRDPAVDVAAEAVLIVPRRAVAVIALFGLTGQAT